MQVYLILISLIVGAIVVGAFIGAMLIAIADGSFSDGFTYKDDDDG